MGTLISAIGIIVAALVATAGYLFNQWQNRNERLAELFADALRPVGEYRGCPFAIRRRQASDAETRSHFAEWLSQMHTSLDYYENLVILEAPNVAPQYHFLLEELRDEVDDYAKDAWKHPAVTEDLGMNMELGQEYGKEKTPRTEAALKTCLKAMNAELRRLKWR